eukprot:4221498-Amphidinium_carterae.1
MPSKLSIRQGNRLACSIESTTMGHWVQLTPSSPKCFCSIHAKTVAINVPDGLGQVFGLVKVPS